MPADLKGVRVFIASPRGLDEERRIFRDTLNAFSQNDAIWRGVSFIPMGWEDALPGSGRPQSKINDDLRRCDFVILVLHDRWGTPPGVTGYTSGTEEEYEVARECLQSDAHPMQDIVVLFKSVDADRLSDPGNELQKVLAFKLALEKNQSMLFGDFHSEGE